MAVFLRRAIALAAVSSAAWALTPAGVRGLRNAQIAIDSVRLDPRLRAGPIPQAQRQSALNLLRDLDSALARGRGEIERMSDADRSDPAVARAAATLDEYRAFREDLQKALTDSAR